MKYRYRIYNPEGKEIIFVFKHAIDDIWEAEE
jgi:sRNA-binding regulator protein Hfq